MRGLLLVTLLALCAAKDPDCTGPGCAGPVRSQCVPPVCPAVFSVCAADEERVSVDGDGCPVCPFCRKKPSLPLPAPGDLSYRRCRDTPLLACASVRDCDEVVYPGPRVRRDGQGACAEPQCPYCRKKIGIFAHRPPCSVPPCEPVSCANQVLPFDKWGCRGCLTCQPGPDACEPLICPLLQLSCREGEERFTPLDARGCPKCDACRVTRLSEEPRNCHNRPLRCPLLECADDEEEYMPEATFSNEGTGEVCKNSVCPKCRKKSDTAATETTNSCPPSPTCAPLKCGPGQGAVGGGVARTRDGCVIRGCPRCTGEVKCPEKSLPDDCKSVADCKGRILAGGVKVDEWGCKTNGCPVCIEPEQPDDCPPAPVCAPISCGPGQGMIGGAVSRRADGCTIHHGCPRCVGEVKCPESKKPDCKSIADCKGRILAGGIMLDRWGCKTNGCPVCVETVKDNDKEADEEEDDKKKDEKKCPPAPVCPSPPCGPGQGVIRGILTRTRDGCAIQGCPRCTGEVKCPANAIPDDCKSVADCKGRVLAGGIKVDRWGCRSNGCPVCIESAREEEDTTAEKKETTKETTMELTVEKKAEETKKPCKFKAVVENEYDRCLDGSTTLAQEEECHRSFDNANVCDATLDFAPRISSSLFGALDEDRIKFALH